MDQVEIKGERGLIGCLDILGYTEVVSHNEIGKVLDLLDASIGEAIAKIDKLGVGGDSAERSRIRTLLGELDKHVFSDTIIFGIPLASNPGNRNEVETLFFFLYISLYFLQKMFAKGLPLRGAIHLGEYFIGNLPQFRQDRVWAGSGIIKAIKEANLHDWSGCVLSSDAARKVEDLIAAFPDYAERLNAMLVRYSVPLKGGGEEPRWVLNFLFPTFQFLKEWIKPSEIRALVVTEFSKNKKVINEKCHSKLLNTEIFLTFCRAEYDRHFREQGNN